MTDTRRYASKALQRSAAGGTAFRLVVSKLGAQALIFAAELERPLTVATVEIHG
jgi:hypothetical protein